MSDARQISATGTRRTLLPLLALYACWGSAIPAMKVMVDTVPPLGGAAAIFLAAGLVLAVAARARPVPSRERRRRAALVGVLLLVGGQGLCIVALTEITASLGAILAAAIPLWVVLLGRMTGEPVSGGSWVRVAIGFGGTAIVVFTAPETAIGGALWAIAAFCIAPLLWAAGTLLGARERADADRVTVTSIQLLTGGSVLFVLAALRGELAPASWSGVSAASAGAAVFLLVFDSLAGFVLYARLLATSSASLVSTYAYVTPLIGGALGATVLDEPLWPGALIGGALVLGAVASELRSARRSGSAAEAHGPHGRAPPPTSPLG